MNFDLSQTIISILTTFGLGVVSLYFKWLLGSFKSLQNQVAAATNTAALVEKNTRILLDKHEDMDQSRHEENLHRFEKISVALARMGSTNGTHSPRGN